MFEGVSSDNDLVDDSIFNVEWEPKSTQGMMYPQGCLTQSRCVYLSPI
jgi:hypothetical protein